MGFIKKELHSLKKEYRAVRNLSLTRKLLIVLAFVLLFLLGFFTGIYVFS